MGEIYEEITCSKFQDFLDEINLLTKTKDPNTNKFHRWIFKGLECSCWDLKTTLERECERFNIKGDDVPRREYNMIREFQRRLHHYEVSVPDRDNIDEWMALMQHFGAPTRLLDFTYSPYVAAFFAFEKAQKWDIAIWAVDTDWIDNKFEENNKDNFLYDFAEQYANYRSPAAFRRLFLKDIDNEYVLTINPFRLNDRLAYQQGLFLCPASVKVGFMKNLGGLFRGLSTDKPVRKYVLKIEERDGVLHQLHKMNINRITLFPGLAGFAESCKVGLMTVFDKHVVKENGKDVPVGLLWERLAGQEK